MMLEQLWLFCHGLDTWHPNPDELTPRDAVLLFADYCIQSDIKVNLWLMNDKLWVLHKGVTIGLDEKGVEILHNGDYAVPDDQIRWRSESDPLLTDEQFASARSYVNSNDFSAEYYDRAATPANLRYPTMTAVRLINSRGDNKGGVG